MSNNIIIVAHKFVTQPDDDLVVFLNQNGYKNILHIRHSFSDAVDRCSYYTWYKEGKIYRKHRTKDYKGWNEALIYLKEFYHTFYWIYSSRTKWDYYIGMDGLCSYWGNILRFLKKVRKTVYWAIDFVPESRFNSGIKNKIYHWINIQGYKKSDEMWDLSPRMAIAREKFLGIKKTDYKSHKIVPYGAWTDRIKKYDHQECQKNTLVFMGHLLEKQGVQLIIRAIPDIIKVIPDFRFKIIGTGKYKTELIRLAEGLKVIQYCDFKGKIENIKELEDEIAKSGLAIAPYIKELDVWTYYADPGKIKTYLACGVPALLTDIPWNAKEIEKERCGRIISGGQGDIVMKIFELIQKDKNQEYRDNAIKYSRRFDYRVIFTNLFKE